MFAGSDVQHEKEIAGKAAVKFVKDGFIVGLGTGSTAEVFIRELARRAENGLNVTCVASSIRTAELATSLGLTVIDDPGVVLDIDVDGADEIDKDGNMIKGAGGALLREKIVASSSNRVIIVADHSKMSEKLGSSLLPVEVSPFMVHSTLEKIQTICTDSKLRENGDYRTDNGNQVIDCKFDVIEDPAGLLTKLQAVPGVMEVGIFIKLCSTALIGKGDAVEEFNFRI